MNASFDFLTREMLMFLVVCLFLMLVFAIGIFILEREKKRILKTRLALTKAIFADNLNDLLKVFSKISLDVFDDAGINFRTTDFLANRINKENFSKIYSSYQNLSGSGKLEAKRIFEQAFSKKKNEFWANLYFVDFTNNDGACSDEFISFFEIFDIRCSKEIWTSIYKDLKRFQDNFHHSGNRELGERLLSELERLKILLG